MNQHFSGELLVEFMLTKRFVRLNKFTDCQEILAPENDPQLHSWVNILRNWEYDLGLAEEVLDKAGISGAEFRKWHTENS
jgi:hypothetical protein